MSSLFLFVWVVNSKKKSAGKSKVILGWGGVFYTVCVSGVWILEILPVDHIEFRMVLDIY